MKSTGKRGQGTESFGQRLRRIRKLRGLSQVEVARKIGISQRMMSYYERHAEWPPAKLLPRLAQVLKVSVDELVGLKRSRLDGAPRSLRVGRKMQEMEQLPRSQQQAVLDHIDALVARYKSCRRS